MGSEFQNLHTGFYGHYNNGFSLYPSTVKVKRKFQVMDVSRKLSIPNEKQLIQAVGILIVSLAKWTVSCFYSLFLLYFISPLLLRNNTS